jgi:hypothetical protein
MKYNCPVNPNDIDCVNNFQFPAIRYNTLLYYYYKIIGNDNSNNNNNNAGSNSLSQEISNIAKRSQITKYKALAICLNWILSDALEINGLAIPFNVSSFILYLIRRGLYDNINQEDEINAIKKFEIIITITEHYQNCMQQASEQVKLIQLFNLDKKSIVEIDSPTQALFRMFEITSSNIHKVLIITDNIISEIRYIYIYISNMNL